MRVLLVEDDVMIGEGLIVALSAEGMSVDWVRDGAAAEAALCDEGFAIVLLDLGLPDADGTNLLKSARKQGVDTPILIITARGAVDDRVSGLDRGADDYLLKPFELRELTARMRALIRRRAAVQPLPFPPAPLSSTQRLTSCATATPRASCRRANTPSCTR